jgi:DNA adenine methylase
VKWAGGKRQLLASLLPLVPRQFKTYHEPFVGGGALFFELQPPRAFLGDTNIRLVRAYSGIRADVDRVVRLLRSYPFDPDFFMELRSQPIDDASDPEVAAWLIYLNKTGFNGLYRVNSRNVFNVPFGRHTNPLICDEPNLRACAEALKATKIEHEPFDSVLHRAKSGDFVYFDPPYEPLSTTSSFTSYTSSGFRLGDQRFLRDVAVTLRERGVHVVLSNSSAPTIYGLYEKHFRITEVAASRSINSNAQKRGPVKELLIH